MFTKFPSCITGPYGDITLPPGGHTDWEVELVVIIGRTAVSVPRRVGLGPRGRPVRRPGRLRADPADGRRRRRSSAWASPTRVSGPVGPYLVTPDEFDNPDDLELGCSINGEQMQKAAPGS